MDDFYWSCNNEEELVAKSRRLSTALAQHGFLLRKWTSSSPNVIRHFNAEDVAPSFRPLLNKDTFGLPSTKALGVTWDCSNDEFTFAN